MHSLLLQLEDEGWRALSSSQDEARAFYRDTLDDDVVMLFPGGIVVADRDAVLSSIGAQPWSWYRIDDARVIRLSEDAAVVTYRATAQRDDQPEYHALVSSAYARRAGRWRLGFHQQTPV